MVEFANAVHSFALVPSWVRGALGLPAATLVSALKIPPPKQGGANTGSGIGKGGKTRVRRIEVETRRRVVYRCRGIPSRERQQSEPPFNQFQGCRVIV